MGQPIASLILAGGKGSRFWPVSRATLPKQFLNLVGEDSFLRSTYQRARLLSDPGWIFVSTTEELAPLVSKQLPDLPQDHILAEPSARNTGPSLLWCTELIRQAVGEDATVLALPSDHWIPEKELFCEHVTVAAKYLEKNPESLLTFGIQPREAHSGYGYIQHGESVESERIFSVEKFIEKPPRQQAEVYCKSGHHLWNAGIFLWKPRAFLGSCLAHLKGAREFLKTGVVSFHSGKVQTIAAEQYSRLDPVSVDCGVLEKTSHLKTMKSIFKWNDLGSWNAVWKELACGEEKTATIGKKIHLSGASRTFVLNQSDRQICVVGVEDLIVIDSGDALLVCRRENDQMVRELLKELDPQLL